MNIDTNSPRFIDEYRTRVAELEREGMTTSDAQGIADIESADGGMVVGWPDADSWDYRGGGYLHHFCRRCTCTWMDDGQEAPMKEWHEGGHCPCHGALVVR